MANYHKIPPDLRASIFISSSIGSLMQLQEEETKTHSKRYRKIEEINRKLYELLNLYPSWENFNYVEIGKELFIKIEEGLQKLVEQQLEREKNE